MILAIEAAGAVTKLWLFPNPKAESVAGLEWESGRRLSDQLLAKLTQFLADNKSSLKDLKAILIFSGPGSFTSLRIGHTTANALADSLGIPVVGAKGDNWLRDALQIAADAKPGRPALPFYGAEAHITRPKK